MPIDRSLGRPPGRHRLRRAGLRADRRLLLAGAAAADDAALVAHQQRGGLDHLLFYAAYMLSVPVLVTLTDRIDAKRVYLFGVGCTVLGAPRLRPAGRRLLVGDGAARAGRHRLGRHLHDRPEAAGRPGRRQDDVARRHRPRRQHRHLGRGLLHAGRLLGQRVRLAVGLRQRRPHRGDRLDHRGARRAGPAAAAGESRRPAGAVRFPPGAAQPLGLRLLARLLRAHAGDERAARLGRGLPGLGGGP